MIVPRSSRSTPHPLKWKGGSRTYDKPGNAYIKTNKRRKRRRSQKVKKQTTKTTENTIPYTYLYIFAAYICILH